MNHGIPDGAAAHVNGRWLHATTPDGALTITSPADLDDVVGAVPFAVSHAQDAVASARAALPAWRALPLAERMNHLRRLAGVLKAHEEALGDMMSREMGKPVREARLEARALVNKIDITLDEGLPLVAGFERDGGKLRAVFRPHGVLAVIGPFNFPLHLAHGHVVPALLMGNTVVFKPSDLTPFSGLLYARLCAEAGLPPGVVNVVCGDARTGAALVDNRDVDGVLFTGSFGVGQAIERRSMEVKPGRMVALELGGKNAAVVLDDAPLEKALLDVTLSAFSTSGQRCTCASRLIVTRGIADEFIARLAELADGLVVGHPSDAGAFMGPLAGAASLRKFQEAQALADAEGSTCVRPPRDVEVRHNGRVVRGYYAAPRVRLVKTRSGSSRYQQEEWFGPDLAVHVVADLDEAIAVANDTPYGLSAGLWTQDAAAMERAQSALDVGCISFNAPTVGSSSRLPFGGVKHSGNHRPAGVTSTLYCAWPMALTTGTTEVAPSSVPPGVPFKVKQA